MEEWDYLRIKLPLSQQMDHGQRDIAFFHEVKGCITNQQMYIATHFRIGALEMRTQRQLCDWAVLFLNGDDISGAAALAPMQHPNARLDADTVPAHDPQRLPLEPFRQATQV